MRRPVFVARHGEAVYESELLTDAGGWLSPLGREQARALASLRGERTARVGTSDMARAVQTGEIVASGTNGVLRELPMPHCGVVGMEADVDGWVARSWAGSPLEAR